jgi:transketolase
MELSQKEISRLEAQAGHVRRQVVRMIASAGAGHPGGSLSATDIIVCLYHKLMKINPDDPDWAERDRFILSKGHACPPLYVTLADLGYFSKDHLMTFDHVDSILQGHPDMTKTPGVDMSTGSLGQGLSVGVGMALAARLRKSSYHTYVLMGDGELQEGQVWEAAMAASKFNLDNLTAIVDWNGMQLVDQVKTIMPISQAICDQWRAFGWNVLEMEGHRIADILTTLDSARAFQGQPSIVIASTIKGKGVSYMEDNVAWHSHGITEDQLSQALGELSTESGAR